MIWLYVIIFTLGIVIGSFLNVCIYRLPRDISVSWPPSHCPSCNHPLSWLDLVPVVSYLFLKGKCRYCQNSISVVYPIIEVMCGLSFVMLFIHFGYSTEYLAKTSLFCGLVVATGIDLIWKIIPDKLNLTLALMGIPLTLIQSSQVFIDGIIGAAWAGGLLLAIAIISRGGMGGGDVKFAAVLGLYLGWQDVLLALFLAFILGSIVGVIYVFYQKKNLKEALPFGPFLSAGTLIVLFYNIEIINWYLNWFAN